MAALGVSVSSSSCSPGRRAWAVGFVAVSPLLIGSLAYSRFDFWPAALLAGALAALLRDRHRLGWGLLGAAVAAKLYPLVLVPLAVGWTLRRRGGRELAWAAGVGAAVVAVGVPPVPRARAARALDERLGPAVAAAADREPRRLGADDLRPPVDRRRATARRTSAGHGVLAALSRCSRRRRARRPLGRVRPRTRRARAARALRGRLRLHVRRLRQGALAAVPDLARAARRPRPRAAWNRRGGLAGRCAADDAGVVPGAATGTTSGASTSRGPCSHATCCSSRSSPCSDCRLAHGLAARSPPGVGWRSRPRPGARFHRRVAFDGCSSSEPPSRPGSWNC